MQYIHLLDLSFGKAKTKCNKVTKIQKDLQRFKIYDHGLPADDQGESTPMLNTDDFYTAPLYVLLRVNAARFLKS